MERLRSTGFATVTEFSEWASVSPITARRDIVALSQRGLVSKTHGGVMLRSGFGSRDGAETPRIRSPLLRAAAALVSPGMSIGICPGPGQLTEALAAAVADIRGVTVVTNSASVYRIASSARTSRDRSGAIMLGGTRAHSGAIVGPITLSGLSLLHVDCLFIQPSGLDEDIGFLAPSLLEAEVIRVFAERASKVIILNEREALDSPGTAAIGIFALADTVIAEDGALTPRLERALRRTLEFIVVAARQTQPGSTPVA